jgi:hypothetical protein
MRRRNPDRKYLTRNSYTGIMEDFPTLRSAVRYAMVNGDFLSADDVADHIYLVWDEQYVPISKLSRIAATAAVNFAKRNPMKNRRNCCNPLRKSDRPRHLRLAMSEVSTGWDYDLVSAEDSIKEYERDNGITFTTQEKAYIAKNAKPGSHSEHSHSNPKRRGAKARAHTKEQRFMKRYLRDDETSRARGHESYDGAWKGSYLRGNYRRYQRSLKSNPGHPAYAQHLMRIGLHHGDPLIELASVWASGMDASPRLLRQAIVSAEHWRESKDKRMRSAMGSVVNKLEGYLEESERRDARRSPKTHRTLHPAWANNPRRRRY